MKLLKEYVKRALYSNYSVDSSLRIYNGAFTSSTLVLQIRKCGFNKYLAPDSIHKAIAELYNEGFVNIDPDSGFYYSSQKLVDSLS